VRLRARTNREFDSPQQLLDFTDSVAKGINKGITKEGVLLRNDDSDKFAYTRIADMDKARQQFATEFMDRLKNGDPPETAAWVHWRLNFMDHFYADGCGKSAEAVADWGLMRAGEPLPTPPDRKQWFDQVKKYKLTEPPIPDGMPAPYLGKPYDEWGDFYKGLFPATGKRTQESWLAAGETSKLLEVRLFSRN